MFRRIVTLFALANASSTCEIISSNTVISLPKIYPQNSCVSFTVSEGTGCASMCEYCANALSTNNYYFIDGVCTYQPGGCVGNPQASVVYTCSAV